MQTATQMEKSSRKSDSGQQISALTQLFGFRGMWLGIFIPHLQQQCLQKGKRMRLDDCIQHSLNHSEFCRCFGSSQERRRGLSRWLINAETLRTLPHAGGLLLWCYKYMPFSEVFVYVLRLQFPSYSSLGLSIFSSGWCHYFPTSVLMTQALERHPLLPQIARLPRTSTKLL